MDDATTPPNLFVFDSAPESSPEFDISDPEVVRTLEESQRTHFWFQARNLQILDFLRRDGLRPPARILEVGCGTGTVLSALARSGYRMVGVEMHTELARRAAAENPMTAIYSFSLYSPPADFESGSGFDAVGLFDVLEHSDHPETVLRACGSWLRPGGRVIGTVPALSALWSDYDAFAGHRLRYGRRALKALLVRAGLPKPRVSYFFQTLVPGMLIRRALVGRNRTREGPGRRAVQHRALDAPGPAINGAFALACAAERVLRRAISIDAVPGASLWFSAQVSSPNEIRAASPPTGRTGGAE